MNPVVRFFAIFIPFLVMAAVAMQYFASSSGDLAQEQAGQAQSMPADRQGSSPLLLRAEAVNCSGPHCISRPQRSTSSSDVGAVDTAPTMPPTQTSVSVEGGTDDWFNLSWRFSVEGCHPRSGSSPFFYVSDTLIEELGKDIQQRIPPFDQPTGKYFRGRWGNGDGSGTTDEWHIPGFAIVSADDAIKRLHQKWLHIAGDSTSEQLFNSIVTVLNNAVRAKGRSNPHHLVARYDDCVPKYHLRRMALLKQKPRNKTAIFENQLALCECRQHLLWWHQQFTEADDGFEFKITYSYKELMFEPADVGLLTGKWDRRRAYNPRSMGNLFEDFAKGFPDIFIANSGAHTFHVPGGELDEPSVESVRAYARNATQFIQFIRSHYLNGEEKRASRCFLWKANNVPPTHRCPHYHFALNWVTVPAMLRAGFHVIDPEELSARNPHSGLGKPCDIHSAPQDKVPLLALSAISSACFGD